MREFNKYQTQLTDDLISSLNREVYDDLLDVINNIEFVNRLISKDRKFSKDLDRDSQGRIIVDLCNPHILEDMDYFRQSAIHFQKYGVYTKLLPNPNPQSEYGKWLKREVERCWKGMTRQSDGEWIPGDMYFYLNYFPIIQTKIIGNSKIGQRVTDFPEMWEGVYWRFHYMHQARYGGLYDDFTGGHHGCEIARRGASKSYSLGAILTKHFLLGENDISKTKVKSLVAAYQKEYLIKDGLLNKFIDGVTHCSKTTQFPNKRLKSSLSDMQWILGFKNEKDDDDGLLNEVIGVAIKDDPDKARGKRSNKMFYEEFGMFPKFLDVWQTSLPNVQEGDVAFGMAYSIGTGGSEGSDFSGALEMINYPAGYNVYALPNYWDKGANGKKNTIFFFPGYINSKGFYNKDGVSDVIGALISEIEFRVNLKYNSSDPMQITRRKAETAFTIQDAIMRRDGSMYPSDKLNDIINQINLNPGYSDDFWIGRLELSKDGEVKYKPDSDLKYITEFPHKDNKLEGACCIFEMPIKDSSGRVPWGRYIAGADVYDDDASNTLSLFSMFILDLHTDRIVFEYTGRPMFADDAYENCRLALLMYNAECNYENNKKGLFKYFSQHNSLYLLSDTLDFLKDKEIVRGNLYGNKAHPYSEDVWTKSGYKKWGEVNIGDYIYGTNGKPTMVIDIPFDDVSDIYRITLKDGRSVLSSENHLWKVIDSSNIEKVISTKDMIISYYRKKGKYKEYKYYIPKNNGVEFCKNDLPMNPYLLGLILGDGCFTNSRYHNINFASSIDDMVNYMKSLNLEYITVDDRHHWIRYKNCGNIFKSLNLHNKTGEDKFIPDIYKMTDRISRLEMLRGLLDSDGNIGYGGNPEFTNTSEKLIDDVIFIARSLGINCNKCIARNCNDGTKKAWRVRFYTNERLFNLERKYSKQKITKTRAFKTAIVNIEYVGKEKSKCVTVDSLDSCYLINDFITTHNSKGVGNYGSVAPYARRCNRDYLLRSSQDIKLIEVDGLVEESIVNTFNYQKIPSKGLLQELAMWTPDGNYDRHDALAMLMLLREDKLRLLGTTSPKDATLNRDANYLGNDDFFDKNYRNKKQSEY